MVFACGDNIASCSIRWMGITSCSILRIADNCCFATVIKRNTYFYFPGLLTVRSTTFHFFRMCMWKCWKLLLPGPSPCRPRFLCPKEQFGHLNGDIFGQMQAMLQEVNDAQNGSFFRRRSTSCRRARPMNIYIYISIYLYMYLRIGF